MEVNLIFQVAGVGLTVAVIYQLLARAGREDQAMLVSVMGVIIVLMMVVSQAKELLETVKSLFDL
ncbi:MAG: stage III sporulation protein AC [Clostridia bacterium]|nr:stage III sporulation protein AC [Clostridia bacterium]